MCKRPYSDFAQVPLLPSTASVLPQTNLSNPDWRALLWLSEEEKIQIYLNFVRDLVWVFWSYQNLGARAFTTDDANFGVEGQWFGQQVAGTGAMAVGLLPLLAWYLGKAGRRNLFPAWLTFVFFCAAAVSIYTWDQGQQLGVNQGRENTSRTPLQIALYASIYTGVFEGLTQGLILLLGRLCHTEYRKNYHKHPIRLGVELSASITIGALPGMIWQIVYALCVNANAGPVPTSILLAITVSSFNYLNSKLTTCMSDAASKWNGAAIFALFAGYGTSYRVVVRQFNNPPEPQVACAASA